MIDYRLEFIDGPARLYNERIYMCVEPTEKRWFCQMGSTASWWVIDGEPPEDPEVHVTEYRQLRQVTDPEGQGDETSFLVVYAKAEPDPPGDPVPTRPDPGESSPNG